MMKENEFFCSQLSLHKNEPMQGTASVCKAFVLVQYNDPFPEKVDNAKLPQPFFSELKNAAKSLGAKLLLVRNESTLHLGTTLVWYVDHQHHRYKKFVLTPQQLFDFELEQRLNSTQDWEEKTFFLVCTNGKKDKCCSKYGLPIFEKLDYDKKVEVYQCSHIGGDRFAANMIAMPYGIYYGRVGLEDVDGLLQATEQKKIHMNNYRGYANLKMPYQAADHHLRAYSSIFDINMKPRFSEMVEDGGRLVFKGTFSNLFFEMELIAYNDHYDNLLTCKSAAKESNIKYSLVNLTLKNV